MAVPHQVVEPCTVDGALVRLMSDGTMDWVEIWTGTEWVQYSTTTFREVMMAPPAGSETLRRRGLPA